MAIFFRGTPFTAKKRFFDGTHRVTSPEETWAKIAPLARKIGVSRVADITGLDRIGIPVTLAIRPASQTLVTSSGKGTTLITAKVSGLMESLELHCAEETILPFLHLSYNQLCERAPVIPLDELWLRKGSLFHPDRPERWSLGWDLIQQEEVAAPTLCVTLNSRFNALSTSELFSFRMSSNGLASGNQFLEALASAIYELIERDAISCHMNASDSCSFFSPRVRLETIPYSSVQSILAQLERAEIRPFLYDCTVDTKVPVYMASIYDARKTHVGCAKGYGAHLDPEVAMIRALTEAVQGRANVIAGSRDDIFPSEMDLLKKYDTVQQRELYENLLPTASGARYHSEATRTLEEDIQILIEKLRQVGISRILVFDLTLFELGVSVLRVIIPGLEDYYSERTQVGKRAKAFAARYAPVHHTVLPSQTAAHFPAGVL